MDLWIQDETGGTIFAVEDLRPQANMLVSRTEQYSYYAIFYEDEQELVITQDERADGLLETVRGYSFTCSQEQWDSLLEMAKA